MKYLSELIILVTIIVASIIGIIGSTALPIMDGSLPGAGLFPLLFGIVIIIFSLIELKKYFSNIPQKDKELDKQQLKRIVSFIVLLTICILVGTPLLGLLPSLGIYLFVALVHYNKLSLKTSIISSIATILIIFIIFSVWLKVQMPWGIFERWV